MDIDLTATPAPTPNPISDAPPAPKWDYDAIVASLPEELRMDPSLKVHKSVDTLFKSYIHAQKAIGADKIIVPGKSATDEDWKNVYKKLGLPDAVDKYELETKKDTPIDPAFLSAFKEKAFAAGILPKQAKALMDWYDEVATGDLKKQQDEYSGNITKEMEGLKKEWGDGFDKNVAKAKEALTLIGDESINKWLSETELSKSPKMIKLMSNLAGLLGEDKISGGGVGGQTPEESSQELNSILGDPKHPYYDKLHPGHADSVAHVTRLFSKRS